MDDVWPQSAQEALADAWASIDGKRDEFRAGRGHPYKDVLGDYHDGYYDGYMHEAQEMIDRLQARGYGIVQMIPHQGQVS